MHAGAKTSGSLQLSAIMLAFCGYGAEGGLAVTDARRAAQRSVRFASPSCGPYSGPSTDRRRLVGDDTQLRSTADGDPLLDEKMRVWALIGSWVGRAYHDSSMVHARQSTVRIKGEKLETFYENCFQLSSITGSRLAKAFGSVVFECPEALEILEKGLGLIREFEPLLVESMKSDAPLAAIVSGALLKGHSGSAPYKAFAQIATEHFASLEEFAVGRGRRFSAERLMMGHIASEIESMENDHVTRALVDLICVDEGLKPFFIYAMTSEDDMLSLMTGRGGFGEDEYFTRRAVVILLGPLAENALLVDAVFEAAMSDEILTSVLADWQRTKMARWEGDEAAENEEGLKPFGKGQLPPLDLKESEDHHTDEPTQLKPDSPSPRLVASEDGGEAEEEGTKEPSQGVVGQDSELWGTIIARSPGDESAVASRSGEAEDEDSVAAAFGPGEGWAAAPVPARESSAEGEEEVGAFSVEGSASMIIETRKKEEEELSEHESVGSGLGDALVGSAPDETPPGKSAGGADLIDEPTFDLAEEPTEGYIEAPVEETVGVAAIPAAAPRAADLPMALGQGHPPIEENVALPAAESPVRPNTARLRARKKYRDGGE